MWIYSDPKDAVLNWLVTVVVFCESCLREAGSLGEVRRLVVRAVNSAGARSMAINLMTRLAIDDELGFESCRQCGQSRFTYHITSVSSLQTRPTPPNPLKERDEEPNPFIDFDKADDPPEAPKKKGRRKGDSGRCSNCGEKGHTKRTCVAGKPIFKSVALGCPYPCSPGAPCVLCIQSGAKPDPSLWV